ncbi:MAG: FAD binding domain-containing protein [Planctomycetota bacterium]
MNPFALTLPTDLAQARQAHKDGAVFKAAGIDLVDRLKERKESLPELVDLLRLKSAFGENRKTDTGIALSALSTLRAIGESPLLASTGFTALREAAAVAATPQVRNRATLGGNLLQKARCWYLRSAGFTCVHGGDGPTCMARDGENRYHAVLGCFDCVRVHPSNTATALCALSAEAEIQTADGTRRIPVRALWPEFGLAGLPEHTLAQGEILLAIHLPSSVANGRSAYREAREKQSFDWPTTAAAAHVVLDGDRIRSASICLGAVSPVPFVAGDAAQSLVGKTADDAAFSVAAQLAYSGAHALSHNAYKIEQGKAVLVDALRAACAKD